MAGTIKKRTIKEGREAYDTYKEDITTALIRAERMVRRAIDRAGWDIDFKLDFTARVMYNEPENEVMWEVRIKEPTEKSKPEDVTGE